MNEYLQQFNQKKQMVIDCLDKAEKFFGENGCEHQAEIVANQRNNVINGEFTIVVVGEFSSGKSTFLNALMGERILPSFTNETTATVNFLKHSDCSEHGEAGTVYYNDGTVKDLPSVDIKTITDYVATNSSKVDVAGEIQHLDLYLDSRFLKDNVTLVDSPGLNGLKKGHREITEQQIEKSSASIFLFSAEQPGRKSEFDFLSGLKTQVKSIIYVLNKIDCIKANEGESVESVVEKLKSNYKSQYPDAAIPEIWPVAARQALYARNSEPLEEDLTAAKREKYEKVSRMEDFENRLWKFLTQGEKAKQQLMAPLDAVINALDTVKFNCEQEQSVLSGSVDISDINEKRLELEEQARKLREMLSDKTGSIKSSLRTAENEMMEELDTMAEDLKTRYWKKMDLWEDIEDIDPENIKKDVMRSLEKIAGQAQSNYADRITDIVLKNSIDAVEAINDSISDSKVEFTLSSDIVVEESRIGLEKYNEEQKRLEKELDRLNAEYSSCSDNLFEAMDKQQEINRVTDQLEMAKSKRDSYEDASALGIPEAIVRSHTKFEKKPVGGIGGFLKMIFVGRGERQVTEEVIDKSDQERYLKERDARLSKYNREIDGIEKELNDLRSGGNYNVQAIQRKQQSLDESRTRKEKELAALRAEFRERVTKQCAAQLRRQKNSISDFIEDSVGSFKDQFKKKIRPVRDATVVMIIDKVAGDINEQIERQQQQLQLLEEKMNTAVEEKEQRLSEISRQLDEISMIRRETAEIIGEIDSVVTDEIRIDVG